MILQQIAIDFKEGKSAYDLTKTASKFSYIKIMKFLGKYNNLSKSSSKLRYVYVDTKLNLVTQTDNYDIIKDILIIDPGEANLIVSDLTIKNDI